MTTVFVTGTGTEVGKTWVLVELVAALRARGHTPWARKPAQSYTPEELGRTDAELLGAATGTAATVVCPEHRWYPVPMAPVLAAAELGRPPFTTADLATEIIGSTPAGAWGFVEGAGGPRSPLARDGDNVDLARALAAGTILLVADAGLGTINAVRLCVEALHGFRVHTHLNRYDHGQVVHRSNRDWLQRAGYPLTTGIADLADLILTRVS